MAVVSTDNCQLTIANRSILKKEVLHATTQPRRTSRAEKKSAYKLIGAEQIGGVQAQIYQYEVHSSAINATYTFWLGADGRFYKLESDSERFKTSTTIEFDPSIKVTVPAP